MKRILSSGRSRLAIFTCLLASTLAGGIFAAAASAPAAASPGSVPAFCASSGPIQASAVQSPLNLSTCPIQGRLLIQPVGNGHLGGGVHVPPPGQTVVSFVLATNGEFELSATNANGRLVIRQSRVLARSTSRHATVSAPRDVRVATDPACGESAHNFIGGDWGHRQLLWYINTSTIADRTNLNVTDAVSNIRQGNINMTTGQNNCGFTGEPAAYGTYQGSTSLYANINADLNCTSNFPDGQNTISFGPDNLFNQSTHTGPVSVTCDDYNTSTGSMIESDIYFGSNVGFVNSIPPNCVHSGDLQTFATHEWGHAYGLDHETSGRDEVMYPTHPACTLRRHLGLGDFTGMVAIYGKR